MRIFYHPETGEIMGTIDGFSDDPRLDDASITSNGVTSKQLNLHLGHPLEAVARRLEDPRDDLTIEYIKIDPKSKHVIEDDEETKKAKKAKRAKQIKDAEEWAKNHKPRDPLQELDELRAEIVRLKSAK